MGAEDERMKGAIFFAMLMVIVFGVVFYKIYADEKKTEAKWKQMRKQREAEYDREMEDWRRQQREAFHFDAEKFLDSFLERNGEEAPTCPICGKTEYDVLRDMAMIRQQTGLEDVISSAIPCASILCRNCGRLELIALGGRYADINKKTWLCDEKKEGDDEP